MKHNNIQILLTSILLVVVMFLPQFSWAENTTKPGGTGSEKEPYIIRTAEDLAWFRDEVNSGNNKIWAKIADDVEEIDMSTVCHAADKANNIGEQSWEPIGNSTYSYKGTFDGNGKTIKNLYINATQKEVGLFGRTYKSTIKDLTLEDAKVTNTGSYTGILVGNAGYGSTLQNIKISDSCEMNGGNDYTGGIAGYLYGEAYNCVNYAPVQGNEDVGGIFGMYETTGNPITACANYGKITAESKNAGGLVGYFASGTIQDCANYGAVKGTDRVAGMAGFVAAGKIQNVFCYGSINATDNTKDVGMVCGYSSSESTEGIVAYYSGATLTINYQTQKAHAFGSESGSKLTEDKATGYTEDLLKSGVVAYQLQQAASADVAWGQDLGATQNAYPVLGSAYKVYLDGNVTLTCTGTLTGTFTNKAPGTEGTFKMEHTGSKIQHEAVAASCTQDGNIKYWTCSGCNRNFSDEQLTQEVSSTTVPATGGHDYDANDKCTKCQQTIPVLTLGNNKVKIDKAFGERNQITGYNLFKYTAKEDGTLEVTASSGEDTFGTLWGSKTDSKTLTYEDYGNGSDFKLTYNNVVKGTTYYIGARHYFGNAIDGDVTLYVTLNGQDVELPEGISGLGKAESPFVLSTAEHLVWFRDQVNSGNNKIWAKIADDVNEIDMNSVCHAANASKNIVEQSWEPIGNENNEYQGIFDGNGITIHNLYIKSDKDYTGFFGYILNGTIKNITFEDAHVESTYQYNTGILAGTMRSSTIQNIKTLSECSVKGIGYTGGIAGFARSCNANNCVNHAEVEGKSSIGGLFGYYKGGKESITACANYGIVNATEDSSGGLVGYFSSGTIKDCANYGYIEGAFNVGGMAGFVEAGKIQNVFCYGNVSSNTVSKRVGMVCGYSLSGSTEGIVAYYSGATLKINYQTQETTHAFGRNSVGESGSNLTEDQAKGYGMEQIASGEVAWLLNGSKSAPAEGETLYWYQKLGDNADVYPVLTSTGENTVYYPATLLSCDGKTSIGGYANNPNGDKLSSHNYQMVETPDEGTTNLYGEKCSVCNTVHNGIKYIKDFCGIKDNNLQLTEDNGKYIAETVILTDGEAYNSPVDIEVTDFKYARTYAANKWQPLYVPFAMNVDQWTGKGFSVASINNFHEMKLKSGDTQVLLEVKKVTSGSLDPNVPYLISCNTEGENLLELGATTLSKAVEGAIDCHSVTRNYVFQGKYATMSGFGANGEKAIYYGVKDGEMVLLTAADVIGPQNWYLTVTNRPNPYDIDTPLTSAAKTISISVIGDGEATGIEDIHVVCDEGESGKHGIFDMQGRQLNAEPTHGIYIKNGKKYVK